MKTLKADDSIRNSGSVDFLQLISQKVKILRCNGK